MGSSLFCLCSGGRQTTVFCMQLRIKEYSVERLNTVAPIQILMFELL